MVLPNFISLKSETNNKYLRYIHQNIEGVHGILQFSGEEVVSQDTKFQVENMAPTIDNPHPQQVHIRSCYNNKYLRPDQEHLWVVAGADEPQEDTLFKAEIDHQNNVRLHHVNLNRYLQISPDNQYLIVSQENPCDNNAFNFKFTIIDWQTLVILPKLLAFKGDDGNYLRVQDFGEHKYLQFRGPDNTIDPTAEFEVFTAGDGSVLIKSTHTHKFWRRNNDLDNPSAKNWIWPDSNDNRDENDNHNENTLFRPVNARGNNGNNAVFVALRNLGNEEFCRSLTRGSIANCLNAAPPRDAPERLEVKELVQSRTISDLNFRLADARIYHRNTDFVVATGEAENSTLNPAYALILLSYEDTKDSTWNNKIDNASFTSLIPTILTSDTLFVVNEEEEGGIIRILGKFDGKYHWGEHHI